MITDPQARVCEQNKAYYGAGASSATHPSQREFSQDSIKPIATQQGNN